MLDSGGAAVQVDAAGYRIGELSAETRQGSLPFPPPSDGALEQLRRQYLGSDRRAGHGIRNTSPGGEDQVFLEAGFLPAETAPHLFGDRRDSYETDMREILTQASPSGQFSVRLPDNILRIWRLPA
jgi:hypothetical protein